MSDDRTFSRMWKNLTGRKASQVPSPEGIERRRMPRVRVLSALHGYEVDIETNVIVRDVSLGGFALESPIAFKVGSEHTFLFSTVDGRETMVRCECRHARTSTTGGGAPNCVAGFQFLPGQQDSLQIIVEVYQRLRERQRLK